MWQEKIARLTLWVGDWFACFFIFGASSRVREWNTCKLFYSLNLIIAKVLI